MQAIDPSEIIVEKKEDSSEEESPYGNLWIRCLARFYDYALWIAVLSILHWIFGNKAPFARYERLIPHEFFLWIPVEALLLYAWGSTPGKFFLKIEIKQGRRSQIHFGSALRRSFYVWLRGLGMMIPILNILCLLIAYQKFQVLHTTSWDRDEHTQITQSPIGKWRTAFASALVIAVLFLIYLPGR